MDRLKHRMKAVIILLLSLATAGFVWLMLMCKEVLPPSLPSLYAAVIISTSVSFTCIPLFFEMTVEIAYPVNEGLVGGFMTGIYNFIAIIFFCLFFIPNIGFIWIDYLLIGSTVAAIPLVLISKETYNRSNVDEVVLNSNSGAG